MSVMDLLKSPKGIDLLEDLFDSVRDAEEYPVNEGYGIQLSSAYEACMGEIATQQAIDDFKSIDGTPSKLNHKWIPGG